MGQDEPNEQNRNDEENDISGQKAPIYFNLDVQSGPTVIAHEPPL